MQQTRFLYIFLLKYVPQTLFGGRGESGSFDSYSKVDDPSPNPDLHSKMKIKEEDL